MKLIPKDAVLAEIDKRQRMLVPYSPFDKGGMVELQVLKDKLNSFEAKEVDLNKETDKYISDNYYGSETLGFFANRTDKEPDGVDIVLCAKHFFELGLRASLTEEKYIGNVKGSYTTTTEFKT